MSIYKPILHGQSERSYMQSIITYGNLQFLVSLTGSSLLFALNGLYVTYLFSNMNVDFILLELRLMNNRILF